MVKFRGLSIKSKNTVPLVILKAAEKRSAQSLASSQVITRTIALRQERANKQRSGLRDAPESGDPVSSGSRCANFDRRSSGQTEVRLIAFLLFIIIS